MHFDCHAHVYHSTKVVAGARYTPAAPAPPARWLSLATNAGLHGGVLVQPSFFGTNNSQMLDALADLDRTRFRGVAVVPLSASHEQLTRLHGAGVRGLRWNLVQETPLPDPENRDVVRFLARMSDVGLHLELHLEEFRLFSYLPALLPHVPRIVIDHFGLPSAPTPRWPNAVPPGLEDRIFIKLSAPYRSAVATDPEAALATLLQRFPAQNFLWGSDWPWTQHEAGQDYSKLAKQLHHWTKMGADTSAGTHLLYGI